MTTEQAHIESDLQAMPSDALASGTVLLNGQYIIDCYLASGGFGITYLARDSLDRVVVIKECFPEAICTRTNKTVMARSEAHLREYQSLVEMFVREARSIAKLDHANIVRVHQVFEDNDTAYMVLDHIKGRDLLDVIEDGPLKMRPAEVKSLLLKLLDAISTVHSQDMLHRDISPDNILVDDQGAPVLIDFGAAREEASKKTRALSALLMVKDGYSPQEFYIAGSQQTPSSDLYALAATFCHLMTGISPPDSQSRIAAIAHQKPDPYEPLAGRLDGYDAEFLEAIDAAMGLFPADRIQTAPDWITRIDVKHRLQVAIDAAYEDEQIAKTVIDLVTQFKSTPEEPPEPVPEPVLVRPEKKKPIIVLDEPDPEPEPEPTVPDEAELVVEETYEAGFDDASVVEPIRVDPVEVPEQVLAADFVPEAAKVKSHSFARWVAISLIAWSMLVAMLDGWPAQIGNLVSPVFDQIFTQSPANAAEIGDAVQTQLKP